MNQGQLSFDMFSSDISIRETNPIVNVMDFTHSKIFDFDQVFVSMDGFEEVHSHNSMAILGDSLNVLRQMKTGSVNLIFADAPYNIGKNFGNNSDRWDTVSGYVEWCKEWIDECLRVLKDDGTMYFMTATQHMPYLDIYVSEKYNVLCRIAWTYDSSGVQSKKCSVLYMNRF